MYLGKFALILCVGVLLSLASYGEASKNKKDDDDDDNGRSDCDYILPLATRLGAPPTAHLPSSCVLGMLSLGVIALLGSGNFWSWRSHGRERRE